MIFVSDKLIAALSAVLLLSASAAAATVPDQPKHIFYQGYNDMIHVPTDIEYLSMMRKDDHDCRGRIHKPDVKMRRAHGPHQRVLLNGDHPEVLAGSRLGMELESQIDSRSAKVGDLVQGKLQRDFYAYNILISPKGATIFGKVIGRVDVGDVCGNDKKPAQAAAVKIAFQEIEGINGQKLDFLAIPATDTEIERGPEHARAYSVAQNGYVVIKGNNGLVNSGGTFGITLGRVQPVGIQSVILKPGDRIILELQKNLTAQEQTIVAEPVFLKEGSGE